MGTVRVHGSSLTTKLCGYPRPEETEVDDLTPQQAADVMARVHALRMEQVAGILKIGAAAMRASISVRQFTEALQAGAEAEFWDHPDVLEADVAAAAWYPERGQ